MLLRATHRVSSGGGTRTLDTRIMIPRMTPENPEKNTHSENRAAPGAAVQHDNNPLDTWLNACPVELDDKRQEIIRQIAQ